MEVVVILEQTDNDIEFDDSVKILGVVEENKLEQAMDLFKRNIENIKDRYTQVTGMRYDPALELIKVDMIQYGKKISYELKAIRKTLNEF